MTTNPEHPPHRSHPIRNTFFTGIFFLVPIAITLWVLDLLVRSTERLAGPYVRAILSALAFETVPDALVKFISLMTVLGIVFLIGWIANFYVGKQLLRLVDLTMLRLPFIRNIYGGTKQIIEAFSLQNSSSFKKVVMLEYPRRDSWVLGFVTNESLEDASRLFSRKLIGVFVPSTPNPTTGFLLYFDPFELYLLDLDVEEAVKLIVSAGLVIPDTTVKKGAITLGESLGLTPPEHFQKLKN